MLNISEQRIDDKVKLDEYDSPGLISQPRLARSLARWLLVLLALLIIIMFLPWTQNIRSKGEVTTLRPEQRPQTVHATIPGRIEAWFVVEGQQVKKGDTLVHISEIKADYFDPALLDRVQKQITAKKSSQSSYQQKADAQDAQVNALKAGLELKLSQLENKIRQFEFKVISDSMDAVAARTNVDVAEQQFKRMEELYRQQLKSLTDFEKRKLKLQETQAKLISSENKYQTTLNELLNAKIELGQTRNEYLNKIAKAESEKFGALSAMFDTDANITKMENQQANYAIRAGFYYITSPVDGFVTQAIRVGLGETIKEGEAIVSIVPRQADLAVELFVKPMDLPLIALGREVRIQFDGWPAVVFSGWPQVSYGTFGGKVFAIDNIPSKEGKFRILVAPDPDAEPWPELLRVGSGAYGIALLKDVSIWYEIWRQLNGFPPDFYMDNKPEATPKSKAPIKSIK